uniref:Uncharacterized protein n=1 Tax=Hordeum vulgare subsp. vulgare TaxID=112509 RepID=A0A8I6WZ30_HORVV
MCALDEWPSHARRNRAQLQDEAGGQKKKGRGVLKGFKASKKRFANGSAKLNIAFSETLGGTVGMNYRSFKDDVVVIMKRKLPLIGVRRCSTYKAYKTDTARLANLPEDLQPEEWEWMIQYFGKDSKFQERSQKNTDNRKKQKTKHRIGSKSYSQVSFEKRNPKPGEEPDCISLWELTHMKDGIWSNTESQDVYDKACAEVKNKETETQGPLSDEQRHNIFQTTYKGTLQCKSSQPRGYGYMAKPSTGFERIRIQIEEQARATAAFQQRNSELSHQVNDLQDQLQAERANTQEIINLERAEREQLEGKLKEERAERERLLEAERTSRLKFEKNMMAKFAEFSKQMGTQQVFTNRIDKENSNPNIQKTLLQRPSPNKAAGARPTVISSNALIHASTRNSRMFKAIDPNN